MPTQSVKSRVTSSSEDYLEAIFRLSRETGVARAKDIAESLGVSRSSVTTALRQLNAAGLINYDPYSYVTLTTRGEELGQEIEARHRFLAAFLTDILGINPDTADRVACRMEHTIDGEVFERLTLFAGYLESKGINSESWLGDSTLESTTL